MKQTRICQTCGRANIQPSATCCDVCGSNYATESARPSEDRSPPVTGYAAKYEADYNAAKMRYYLHGRQEDYMAMLNAFYLWEETWRAERPHTDRTQAQSPRQETTNEGA